MSRNTGPAVAAKISAMYGKRIRPEDYNALLACKTIQEITLYLKSHPAYAHALREVDAAYVHRDYLEAVLRKAYFRDFLKLYHYLDKDQRQFLSIIIYSYEIDEILWCVSRIHDNDAPIISPPREEYFDRYSKLDFVKLSQVTDLKGLLAALEGTQYADMLAPLTDEEGDLSYSAAEHCLRAYYFKLFFARIKKYTDGKKAEQIKKSIGIEVDTLNLMLIYRLQLTFELTPEEVRAYLFDQRYKLSDQTIEALLEARTPEQFADALRGTPYREIADAPHLHQSIQGFADRAARKNIHFGSEPIARILSYLTYKDTELHNLKTIVEGCRYNMSAAHIVPLLINYQKAGETKLWQ